MRLLYTKLKITTLTLVMVLLCALVRAQCPHVFDFYGQVVDEPYWYSCSGSNFSFNLTSPNTWGDYTIDWGDGSPMTTGTSWSPPTFINHIYAAAVDTFNVTITEINTGCVTQGVVVMEEASSASIQIPVGGLTQACAPQVMEFINSSTNVSETSVFTWDFGDGSPILTFDYTNWQQTIAHTYEVGTVTCETEVTLTAENYCNIVQGGNSTATFNPIRIWDLDDPAITASATLLCYPDTTVTFTNTTYRNCLFQGNIYQRYEWWNFGDYWNLGHDSIIDWTPWPPTFPHTMHYPGIGTYTVQLLDSNFCGVAPTSITIQIVPPPQAAISASADTVCIGEPITFYQQASGGANFYKWNLGTGAGWIPTGSGNITYIYNTPGTYTIGSMVGISGATAGCTDTTWVQVVVMPAPTVEIIASQTDGCDAFSVDFDGFASDAITWQWQFDVAPFNYSGQDPPIIDYNTPGNHLVTLSVIGFNGCAALDNELIHVYQSPVVDFSVTNLCEGDTAQFIDLSYASPNDNLIGWSWNFGDGNTSTEQNPTNYFDTPGIYEATLFVNSVHCFASDTMTLTVEDAPVAEISQDITTGCTPVTVQFDNTTVNAVTHYWQFGDGAISGDYAPSHVFTNPLNHDTTYVVTMTALNAFGCGTTDTLYVTPMPNAIAAFVDNNNPPGCSPMSANFINSSMNADSYLWNFGDGATSNLQNPSHLYLNETGVLQTYTVTLHAFNDNGCNDTITHPIIVYPVADFDFTITGTEGCAPLTATMPFIQGAAGFQWDFGDGSTSSFATPTHTFQNITNNTITYDVELIGLSAFGCVDTSVTQVIVHPTPVAQFNADITSGCSPLTVNFTNLTINADNYEWTYGDGGSSTSADTVHQHVFINNTSNIIVRTIDLLATSTDGCADTYSITIEIYPGIQAGFSDPIAYCSPATVPFVNTSINAANYSWDFGNGMQSIQQNPTAYYTNNTDSVQSFDISMMATSIYGCSDTAYADITIYPAAVAAFNTDVLSGCNPLTVNFTNNSANADIVEWDFGDGETSMDNDSTLQHIFTSNSATPETFDIVLSITTTEGCSSQTTGSIQVNPQAEASFILPQPQCSPATLVFMNTSDYANAYSWDFGNFTQSQLEDPSAYFANTADTAETFNITLTAFSPYGCNDDFTAPFVLHPTPVANFTLNESAACAPGPMEIANQTEIATSYQWNYGDGNTSTIADSIHIHTFEPLQNDLSIYTITLVASTDFGCTDVATSTFEIYPDVFANFTVDTIGCSPFNAMFTNQSIDAVSYQWSFGDGPVSGLTSPSHQYLTSNTTDTVYVAQLIATSVYGCSDTLSKDIHVMHTPVAIAQMDSVYGCFPTEVDFLNASVGADFYSWIYGTGQTSQVSDSLHTFSFYNYDDEPVTYMIMLHAYTNFGCQSTDVLSLVVAPQINADFYVEAEGCTPVTANFDNTSEGGFAYSWDFGDGEMSNEYEPEHTFFNWTDEDTTYTVTFVLQDNFGCTDTAYAYIAVYAEPNAGFTVTPIEQTWPNATITLDNTSTGGAMNNAWDMDDGTDFYIAEPGSYTYGTWGEYDIRLIVSNGGCSDTTLQTIEILPPSPVANFEGPAEGCVPLTVHFTNLSEYAMASEWTFGDGGEANAHNPIYTYWQPGTYTVSLTITGPDGSTDQMVQEQIIHVYPSAHAAFTVVPNEVNIPAEPVYCLNLSQNANIWQWDFGDGSTSTAENPIYFYQEEGVFSVQLIANNQHNCPDTMMLAGVVHAQASGMIDFPNAFSPDASASNSGYYDALSFDNDVFFPMHKGVEDYKLQIFNKWGELLFESNDVNRGWDGYYLGKMCKQDVYVWKVTARFVDGQQVVQSGDVTLISK